MRTSLALAACAALLLGLAPTEAFAEQQCPPGKTLFCPQPRPMRPPLCYCVAAKGYGGASYGKAEVKTSNVPQVRPNKQPRN